MSSSSHLKKARAKMTIYAQKKATNSLDGEYKSIYKGRSMDFEDLRNYVVGDDIKDIDWKATARSGETLIRRYVAEKKHNIMLVADIGNNMTASSTNKENKNDIAISVAEIISYIANKHGDYVGLIAGNDEIVKTFPLKQNMAHVEKVLNEYSCFFNNNLASGNMASILEYISRKIKKRMILFIITDSNGVLQIDDNLLKRILVNNELMFIVIEDAKITDQEEKNVYDMDTNNYIPKFIRESQVLKEIEREYKNELYASIKKRLQKKGISSTFICEEKEIVSKIIRMLEGHKNGKYI